MAASISFVTNFGAKKLFLREPGGGYLERAGALGLAAITRLNTACGPQAAAEECLILSWSAALSDFDLDGYDELLVVNGETEPDKPPPVLMFTRGPDLPYREVSPGIACTDARGLVVTDVDGDGDQDVVIAQTDGPLQVYENRGQPADGSWLRVALRGQASNREGVGAIVTVHMSSGRTQAKVIGAGGVMNSSSPAEAFFGLGRDGVEEVDVAWPSGRRSQVASPGTGMLLMVEPAS